MVGVQLFHFLSLHKLPTYPPSFLVLFQLIKFHQFLVTKCFCIHDSLSKTNQHQSLSLLRFVFLHFVSALSNSSLFVKLSALSNSSLFVKLFLFLSFFLVFGRVIFSALMLCKPGFYFLLRNNVSFKTVSGESKAVMSEMVAGWNAATLPTLLTNYGLENIYNADELGLFYQCLPDKSYQLKTEKCSGGKHSKIRITGLAAANAVGNKLPRFVIGKTKNPRCFKNIKKLPCRYRSQRKSWMDSVLFEEWVRDVNKKFQAEGRKVALIIDNCPAYPIIARICHT